MDIMELGAIGEFVSAVVVIGSLLFVGLQIRQNTYATRAASHHAWTDSANEINLSLARDSEVAGRWQRWLADRSALDDQERYQGDMMAFSMLRIYETLHYQSSLGAAGQDLLSAERRTLVWMGQQTSFREWWQDNPFSFDDDFRAYIDSFLSSTAA